MVHITRNTSEICVTRRQFMAVDVGIEPTKPFFRLDALAMRSLVQPGIYHDSRKFGLTNGIRTHCATFVARVHSPPAQPLASSQHAKRSPLLCQLSYTGRVRYVTLLLGPHGRTRTCDLRIIVVREKGLEPSRSFDHQPLKLACLPFHHSRTKLEPHRDLVR